MLAREWNQVPLDLQLRSKQKQNKADKLAKKAKKKEKKFDKKYNEEVFYDWREEFLHEVEKRGDKKEKKVIDVMRGKNQVEFNPVTEANVSERHEWYVPKVW